MNDNIRKNNILKHLEILNKKAEEFANNIPFHELENYLAKELGLDKLNLHLKVEKKERFGLCGYQDKVFSNILIDFESDNLYIKDKLLANLVKSIKIFNAYKGTVIEKTEDNNKFERDDFDYTKIEDLYVYFIIDLRYIHHDNGKNGHTIARVRYNKNGWNIEMTKDL